MSDPQNLKTIAVIGGTGREGKGLVYRFAKAGYRVLIGSRTHEKACGVVAEISRLLGCEANIIGMGNLLAAKQADIIILAVPYSAHREMLETIKAELKGKLLVDVAVPLVPPIVTRVQMPKAGSAAQEACTILGDDVRVSTAFQNISYEQLVSDDPVQCDILVTGTNNIARSETLKLVTTVGFTCWNAGPIENSVVVEGLTSILIGINKQFGGSSAGIHITGVKAPAKN